MSHGHCYAISPVIHKWFFWESRLQHKCTWWPQVLWKFWIFLKFLKFWNSVKILKFWTLKFLLKILKFYEFLKKNSGFLDSDRGSRITITVVCPISDVQLKIPRKLFKLPVNSSAAVNGLENYGSVNSLSVKNVKQ